MRVAVIGAGAMGSIFGAAFARAGLDTTLVDTDHVLVDHLRAHGLVVSRDRDETVARPAATTDPAEVGPVDLVLFLVKCYATQAAAELARPLVGARTVVASLQNGWGNGEILAGVFDPRRLVLGVTYHSGTVTGRGRVAHTGVGPTFIGPHRNADLALCERLFRAIEATGMEVSMREDVEVVIWQKLILNAAVLPTSALTRLPISPLAERPVIDVLEALAREGVAVAQAAGHPIELEERLATIHRILAGAGMGKASMLQDVEAGRRTEIDVINGAVIRAAERHGIDVPVNRALFALVKGVERARELSRELAPVGATVR